MKNFIHNQEILLNADADFFKRECCENGSDHAKKKLSQPERIAELCWDGMLPEMLPYLCERDEDGKPLALWEIEQGEKLMYLRFGEMHHSVNNPFSIHPSVFLVYASYN